jgi:hypothetical protein
MGRTSSSGTEPQWTKRVFHIAWGIGTMDDGTGSKGCLLCLTTAKANTNPIVLKMNVRIKEARRV